MGASFCNIINGCTLHYTSYILLHLNTCFFFFFISFTRLHDPVGKVITDKSRGEVSIENVYLAYKNEK